MKAYLCGGCRRTYPRTAEYFHANAQRSDGLQQRCKGCMCAAAKLQGERRRSREREQRAFAIGAFARAA